MTDQLKTVQDIACGGAWPLVVRGLTCLALIQLTSEIIANYFTCSIIGTPCDLAGGRG